jgi:ferritin-like metal-binding protein YciE
MKTLQDLFLDSLADMHFSEKRLCKALPKMAAAAADNELRAVFDRHLSETEGHVQKLEETFAAFGIAPRSKKCPAILGIIKEAEELATENKKSPTIDAALIHAAQKAEHYEIASYGGLREWARLLGNESAADIVDGILDEEKSANATLTRLAVNRCNEAADADRFRQVTRAH